LGVNFLAGVFVVRLCRSELGDIAGALVIDPARQGLILIQSKAIVLDRFIPKQTTLPAQQVMAMP